MTRSTRAFLWTGLLSLLGATLLHLLALRGSSWAWPALIHLMLFGWISAMIIAVNYHTLPVFSARDFAVPWLLDLHWLAFTGGIGLAAGGLLVGSRGAVSGGLLLELVAALCFVVNTLLLFARGARRAQPAPPPLIPDQPLVDKLGTTATKGAGLCLPLALLILLTVQLGWSSGSWWLAAEHLATLGWMMLMIVGVAYHVLPRFTGRGVRGLAWARMQLLCHYGALILMIPALAMGWKQTFAIGGLLMALSLALFGWTIWPTLEPVRPRLGPIMLLTKEPPR